MQNREKSTKSLTRPFSLEHVLWKNKGFSKRQAISFAHFFLTLRCRFNRSWGWSVKEHKDESGAVLFMLWRKGRIPVAQRVPLFWCQFYNSWKTGYGRQNLAGKLEEVLAHSIPRACCCADDHTDVVTNRKLDVFACTFVQQDLSARFNAVTQAGD